MKISFLITAILVVSFTVISAQEIKYDELPTITKVAKYTSYVSKDGSVYKIGDKIKIGFPSSNKTFAFLSEGDGILTPTVPLNSSVSGKETEIKNIWTVGTKRQGFTVTLKTKGAVLMNYNIDLENAIASGEVKSFGMTSDEALAALKKGKDKLDLGLITTEEYEKLKAELVKYIK